MSARDKQVGGDHYKQGAIQPIEYIHAHGMDFMTGNIIKYATRWKHKGQALSDLRKVIHYAELLIEAEGLAEVSFTASLDEAIDKLKLGEAQPVEGSPCGFCDCAEGTCFNEMSDEAYAQWMEQMTHPDAKPVNYETR